MSEEVETEKKGGFPFWILVLILLLLIAAGVAGYFFYKKKKAKTKKKLRKMQRKKILTGTRKTKQTVREQRLTAAKETSDYEVSGLLPVRGH